MADSAGQVETFAAFEFGKPVNNYAETGSVLMSAWDKVQSEQVLWISTSFDPTGAGSGRPVADLTNIYQLLPPRSQST